MGCHRHRRRAAPDHPEVVSLVSFAGEAIRLVTAKIAIYPHITSIQWHVSYLLCNGSI